MEGVTGMRNLTFDEGLLKEHPPEPLDGHAVVVFRRAGDTGEVFHSILLAGATPPKTRRRPVKREPAGYFACAVDTSPERHLRFHVKMRVVEFLGELDVMLDLAYAVSDPRVLAQARKVDPLRKVRDNARRVARREVERLPPEAAWEAVEGNMREVEGDGVQELREFAGAYGIAIRSLRFTVHLPMFAEMRPEAGRSRSRDGAFRMSDDLWYSGLERDDARFADEPLCLRGGMDGCGRTVRPVLLGGSAPRQARPGDVVLAQFAAYVAGLESRARQVLEREASPDEVRLGVETECQWAVGARVSVRCRAAGLVVRTPVQGFVWNGECRAVSFDLEVPEDARPRRTVIVMEAFVHDQADGVDAVQVARLAMTLEIGAEAPAPAPPQMVQTAAARTAFASYASQDRPEVLARISSIRRSAGLEVFVDVVSLRMGEEWKPALRQRIMACDRFLLFWSEHARDSPWVTWEWQQALDVKGDDGLELHLLRHVSTEGIPERLLGFHFNDVYLQARDAELYRREHALPPAA